jgi:beta-lactamase class A
MRRGSYTTLRWVAIALLFVAVILLVFQLVRYSRLRSSFPPGTTIAGIPMGGMDQQQAADRLIGAYNIPLTLYYGDSSIQVRPSALGFELSLSEMITAADVQRTQQPFWISFWESLWNRLPSPITVPLSAKISDARMKDYLQKEIAPRYDQPASPAMPVPGSVVFQPGQPGKTLNIDRSVALISDALKSASPRTVNLSYDSVSSSRPGFNNLETLLKQIIDLSGFDGIAEVYIQDLQTGQDLHFAYQQGEVLPVDISFTAASSIKIPVLISTFRRTKDPAPSQVISEIEGMIERSDNTSTDALMQSFDRNLGPLVVSDDIRALGLENTFISGYFYPGAPLLKDVRTKANSRTDVNTNPDRYNQTTPIEIGMLLEDIYQCAKDGGGALVAVFDGDITQHECQLMIDYLSKNKNGVLLQAGLPDGAHFAHKHGWITESDGLMHTISDAGIVFSPGGDYSISVYLYHPDQILFDPINLMVAQLSSAVYNYYNMSGVK